MTNTEYKKFLEKKHPTIFKLNEKNATVEVYLRKNDYFE